MMDAAGSSLTEPSLSLSSDLILDAPRNRKVLQSPLPAETVAAARGLLEWRDKSYQKWHSQPWETIPLPPLGVRAPLLSLGNLGSV